MLRDITSTSTRLNTPIVPCCRRKRVKFTEEGTFLLEWRLTVAMAAEKKQKKRLKGKQQTPKKQKVQEKPVIGSSSTWKEEELERFKVQRGGEVDVKSLIPEK